MSDIVPVPRFFVNRAPGLHFYHAIHAIGMMFICLFISLSLHLSVTGVHCAYMLHVSTDLTLWLDSP